MMNTKQEKIDALDATIDMWQQIVDGDKIRVGYKSNPCCIAFHERRVKPDTDKCYGCPIKDFTTRHLCVNTPYAEWVNYTSINHEIGIFDEKSKMLAMNELNFLNMVFSKLLEN